MESADITTLLMFTFSFLIASFILTKIYRFLRLRHYEVTVRDVSKGHRWMMIDMFHKNTFCSISYHSIVNGAQCDSCGICVDDINMKGADKKIPCKCLSLSAANLKHHWNHGNIPQIDECSVCSIKVDNSDRLSDYWCAWCQSVVHENCFDQADSKCSLGEYRNVIVPPNCVSLKWVRHAGAAGRRHLIVSAVKKPDIQNWSPIIIIGNRKSGNNEGENVLSCFRTILNPAQVIDLCDVRPESALEWCHLLPDVTVRILVAGGDGTVGWVLNAIEKLKLNPKPQIGIIPLGTGNDLSRILDWGDGVDTDVNAPIMLREACEAYPVKLDRWRIDITHEKRMRIPIPKKTVIMNNYMSIGVDALVTLNFHKQRESRPWLFANRLLNKFCYFTYGTKDIYERECKNLEKKLVVELDGKRLDLPEIEGIVLLNISSWGGGCKPWDSSTDDLKPASHGDKLIEVMGLYSSFHIAQLQVGLASPLKLGQAREVSITLRGGNAPMQIDGEPWEQHSANITVSHFGQADMLSRVRHQQSD